MKNSDFIGIDQVNYASIECPSVLVMTAAPKVAICRGATTNVALKASTDPGITFIWTIGTRTLLISEMHLYAHTINAKIVGCTANLTDFVWGISSAAKVAANFYAPTAVPVTMNPGALSKSGSGQFHINMMPYLAVNFNTAMQWIFPSWS